MAEGAIDKATCTPRRPNGLTPNLGELSGEMRKELGELPSYSRTQLDAIFTSIDAKFDKAHLADRLLNSNQTVESAPGLREAYCLRDKLKDGIAELLARGLRSGG